MFICEKCGSCCQNLHLSEIYGNFHQGDGVCIYYDSNEKLCSIYETRPLICRVEEGYFEFLQDEIEINEYFAKTKEVCEILKCKQQQGSKEA